MTRAAPTRFRRENDCPTSPRSAIVPSMSIESPFLRGTASAHDERENDREEAMAHGHCEHWDHSRDSAGAMDDAEAWAAVLRRDRIYDGRQ